MDVIHLTIYVNIIPVFFLIFEEMGQFCPSLINNNNSTKFIIGFWCILNTFGPLYMTQFMDFF